MTAIIAALVQLSPHNPFAKIQAMHPTTIAPISRVYRMKMMWLACRNNAIGKKNKTTQDAKHPTHSLPKPKPNYATASNLTWTARRKKSRDISILFQLVSPLPAKSLTFGVNFCN
jgi:hypothetical protein